MSRAKTLHFYLRIFTKPSNVNTVLALFTTDFVKQLKHADTSSFLSSFSRNPYPRMKKSFLTILFSFFACCLFSQRIPFNQALKQSLHKVVLDFPNAFQSIKGEALPSELGAIQYQSQHALKGSLENKIIGYPSANKTVWSFESKLLATDNFAQFRNAYRAFYQDLNSPQLFKKEGLKYRPEAPYLAPTETLRQISNLFRVQTQDDVYTDLVIDLSGMYIDFNWVIYLRVYEKQDLLERQ